MWFLLLFSFIGRLLNDVQYYGSEKNNEADWFLWSPWFFIGTALVIFLLLHIQGTKITLNNWWKYYRNHTAIFLLSSYGLIHLINNVYLDFFSFANSFSATARYWNVVKDADNSFKDILPVLFPFFALIPEILARLWDIALWRRLKQSFKPFFIGTAFQLIFSLASGIFGFFWERKWNDGLSNHPFDGITWWSEHLFNYFIFPFLGFLLILFFYRSPWFKKAKVEKDPALPSWASTSKFWWWITGLFIGITVFAVCCGLFFL